MKHLGLSSPIRIFAVKWIQLVYVVLPNSSFEKVITVFDEVLHSLCVLTVVHVFNAASLWVALLHSPLGFVAVLVPDEPIIRDATVFYHIGTDFLGPLLVGGDWKIIPISPIDFQGTFLSAEASKIG